MTDRLIASFDGCRNNVRGEGRPDGPRLTDTPDAVRRSPLETPEASNKAAPEFLA